MYILKTTHCSPLLQNENFSSLESCPELGENPPRPRSTRRPANGPRRRSGAGAPRWPKLTSSIGEGSNQSNFSHQSSVKILSKLKILEFSLVENSKISKI